MIAMQAKFFHIFLCTSIFYKTLIICDKEPLTPEHLENYRNRTENIQKQNYSLISLYRRKHQQKKDSVNYKFLDNKKFYFEHQFSAQKDVFHQDNKPQSKNLSYSIQNSFKNKISPQNFENDNKIPINGNNKKMKYHKKKIKDSRITNIKLYCPDCREIHCDDIAQVCEYGWTRDLCGCCWVCAKGPGSKCGGVYGYLGRCGNGLVCVPSNHDGGGVFVGGVSEHEGHVGGIELNKFKNSYNNYPSLKRNERNENEKPKKRNFEVRNSKSYWNKKVLDKNKRENAQKNNDLELVIDTRNMNTKIRETTHRMKNFSKINKLRRKKKKLINKNKKKKKKFGHNKNKNILYESGKTFKKLYRKKKNSLKDVATTRPESNNEIIETNSLNPEVREKTERIDSFKHSYTSTENLLSNKEKFGEKDDMKKFQQKNETIINRKNKDEMKNLKKKKWFNYRRQTEGRCFHGD